MHVTVVSYGEPKKGYPNLILGNLWATQPIALLIWPPLNLGQLKVNINQVMCHLFMKLSDTFDQNPLCTFDKIREKPILMKNALTA